MLGRYFDAHVDVVDTQIAFGNLTLFLGGQLVQNLGQLCPDFTIDYTFPVLGHNDYMVFAVPLRMG